MNAEVFNTLRADRAAKRPVVLLTTLPTGGQVLVHPDEQTVAGVSPALVEAARQAASRDEATTFEDAGTTVFVQPFNPPLRLILVGAVHISQPLASMAVLAGFTPFIIDPRKLFASEARFPGIERSTEWPDKALATLAPDSRTAVVTLTHDPKLDDPALDVALRSKAFYIGCLGSGKTHASRLQRLKERGFGDTDLARLHGPVGLPINARSAGEVAVSILAEIIGVLRPEKPRKAAAP